VEGRSRTRGQQHLVSEGETPFPHPQAGGSDGPHVWAASQRTLQQKRRSQPFRRISPQERATGTIMTTTLIYEPIAHISDDYFRPPKADGSVSSRDNTNDQGVIETRRLALNITDGTAIGWAATLPDVNVRNAWEIIGSPVKPAIAAKYRELRGIHHDSSG
jgi:hypothetical protein